MYLAIQELLNLGAISVCSRSENDFISNIFLAPKANGGKRFILNLKSLNKYIDHFHFKMEDHRTAARLIPKGGYLATVDLKEAYLLIPVVEEHRKYLRFVFGCNEVNNITYQFNALPYGLSVAPWVFTKIMKEVVNYLRSNGHKSVIYLDDILCIGDTYSECYRNVRETLSLLECLGFIVNYKKSVLEPQQSCKFLGFIMNSADLSLSLPSEKRVNVLHLVKKYSKLPKCTIREFSQLIGVLISACPAIRYGWLYTKYLERQKFLALQKYQSYESKIKLDNSILPDLRWWETNITTANNFMRTDQNYAMEIFTDASRSGWGAYCNGSGVNGNWKDDEMSFHINYLELLAIFMGLKCFVKDMSECSILLRVDNTTALSYINRMGGIQFPHLNNLTREIWQWCEQRNIFLFASYINTRDNVEADAESRKINVDTEWELSDKAFRIIVEKLGQPDIDLFATRTNAKCPIYISWKPDPDALTVDAFTVNWHTYFFYAFPPFALILKCLRKILDNRATGVLVFPYWPGQPWFPLLKSMVVSEIIYFKPNRDLLRSRFRSHHPLSKRLTLGAVTLSGRLSPDETRLR